MIWSKGREEPTRAGRFSLRDQTNAGGERGPVIESLKKQWSDPKKLRQRLSAFSTVLTLELYKVFGYEEASRKRLIMYCILCFKYSVVKKLPDIWRTNLDVLTETHYEEFCKTF